MAAVELRGLTKLFASLKVVDDVSIQIEHGSLVCLLGPSGCGKTTTLRLIAGFIEPSGGEIRVGDRVVSTPERTLPPERRNMSMIFQSYALWPHMTVAENVIYGLKLRKVDRDTIARKLAAILSTTRLAQFADRYPGELSGGQQQRVALARALIVEPETLLLDEPLSNLDANLREEMRFEVRRLHDEYRYTTIYVTHDQAEAMTTADVIAVMNAGKIEQAGSPEDIYDRPRSEFVARFIGMSNVIKGKVLDASRIDLAGTPLRTTGAALKPGDTGAVSIRQHDIEMSLVRPQASENVFSAKVLRHVFLGGSRDYMVEVVTGAGRNIGRAIALALAADGASVLVNARSNKAEADSVVDEIEKAGGKGLAAIADVAEAASVEKMIAAAIDRFGRIDILINNAAIRAEKPLDALVFDEWRRVHAVILDGAFHCVKNCLPHLKKSGAGTIVNIGGLSAHTSSKGRAHVVTAKAGLIGFTRALANDLAADNVTVNCVAPGLIDTRRSSTAPEPQHHSINHTLAGKRGTSEDIAATVRFLCGPGARYITGQTIHVNGGAYLGS